MREVILHIVRRGDWEDAARRGSYAPGSLRDEGFIHCSTPAQVIDTANRFYRGQRDLIVLCIEEVRLKAEVRWEAPVGVNRGRNDGVAEPSPNLSRERTGEAPNGRTGEALEKETGEVSEGLFPHLYGELNVDAVVRVIELPCEEDGSFRMLDRAGPFPHE